VIVERRVYKTKPFCEQAALDLVKEVWAFVGFPNAYRLYQPISGPFNVIYHELEFKDMQEREQFWADFWARPQTSQSAEWTEKWKELTESGGGIEFSTLVE
jgi:hypothetical protein